MACAYPHTSHLMPPHSTQDLVAALERLRLRYTRGGPAGASQQPEITFEEARGGVEPAQSSQSGSSSSTSSWLWRRLVGSPTVRAASDAEGRGDSGSCGCCTGSSGEHGAAAAEERSQGAGRAASRTSGSPSCGGSRAEIGGDAEVVGVAAVRRRERQRLMGSDLIWLAELLHIMRPVLYVFMLRR